MPGSPTPNSTPGPQASLPGLLEAKLKQSLARWGWRTAMWGIPLAWLSTRAALGKFLFIGWIIFSLITLAALLLGLKMAKKLGEAGLGGMAAGMGGGTSVGGGGAGGGPDVFGNAIPRSPHATSRPPAGEGDIIEIEAEVLPPEPPEPPRHTA